jgi:hypothetical protein
MGVPDEDVDPDVFGRVGASAIQPGSSTAELIIPTVDDVERAREAVKWACPPGPAPRRGRPGSEYMVYGQNALKIGTQ